MIEAEWNICTEPQKMLEFLRGQISERKLRLLACACCRGVWHLLEATRSRTAIEVAERYADGIAKRMARWDSRADAVEAANALQAPFGSSKAEKKKVVAYAAARATAEGWDTLTWAVEAAEPTNLLWLLRDICGNPFRTVVIDQAWLTPTVLALAQPAYDDRILPAGTLDNARLAVLADALEDAGCANEAILTHLRGPGGHCRGCWVIDSLLGKSG